MGRPTKRTEDWTGDFIVATIKVIIFIAIAKELREEFRRCVSKSDTDSKLQSVYSVDGGALDVSCAMKTTTTRTTVMIMGAY